jgi:RHS repeat-associated protein
MRTLNRLLCGLGVVVGLALQPAQAILPGGGGDNTGTTTTYFEQGILIRSGEVIEALGPNLMGDAVNEYSGSLEFTHTDVALPGNFALPVRVGRHRAVGTTQTFNGGLFGDWDLDIPRLHAVATVKEPNWYGGRSKTNLARCSQFEEPPGTYTTVAGGSLFYFARAFWDGYHLYVPGSGDQTLLRRAGVLAGDPVNSIAPTDGGSYPILTKNHWQINCLPALDNGDGEGFMALAPDGTRYRFDHLVVRPWQRTKVSGMNLGIAGTGIIERVEVSILPTQVTDRFGNWVRYTYSGSADGWRVASITSSDGRSVTFTYNGSGNRIATASDGTRTWTYGYGTNGALETVTQPDGSRWQFALGTLGSALPFASPDPGCVDGWGGTLDETAGTGTITHPSGAVGTFTLKATSHGRSNVPGSQSACGFTSNPVSRYFATRSLTSKTLSGPGMPAQTWSYAYSFGVGSFAPCNGCVNTKTVTTVDPLGHTTVNTYGTMYGLNEGLLLNSAEGVVSGTPLKTTSLSYALPTAGPYPAKVGYVAGPADSMSRVFTPQVLRTITQQGVTFTQQVSTLDVYARPVNVSRSSSIGSARNEVTTYYDDTRLWVLGQVTGLAVNGVAASYTSYWPDTALPMARFSFGKLLFGLGYQADGNVARLTDGLGRVTYFSNYSRGLPQRIGFPDGRAINAVVNNIGTIDSATNEAGITWRFGYDAMGRLALKTPPSDSVAWHPTLLKFEQVNAPEVGLEAGHWRQTITTGNAVTVNYFDARWRKRLTLTYDASNAAATQRAQRFDYDPYNRTTFAAYPARSIADVFASVPGTRTGYDALGRVVSSVADSELGPLTSSKQYLNGFQTLSINPRGLGTVTTFQVFDEPSESSIASITAPEGLRVTINRDVFSKPLSITRSGTWNGAPLSATRSYVYDANHRLCKTVEPETGATIEAVDAADNVAWRATGLSFTSTASCDQASVPAASKVSYGYDTRKRLLSTSFGDGSPGITRTYTPDGLPLTVASGSATWSYGYNPRRLLTNEWLAYGGSTLNIGRFYDPHGYVRQLFYPDGTSLTYAPNALGEPTQVGSYASGVSYHPNGAVAGYTLGNGIVHTLTQNLRGLPLVNRDAGVLQDRYAYDANGNVAGITDLQEGVTTRTMGYDGLDRLTAAAAPGVWGTGLYGYDVLGNLRTSRVGSRNATHNYGANNLLANINVNGTFTGYAHDGRGNVTGRGTQGFFFDLGNRMVLANGVASYSYDGHGRRVGVSGNNGLVKTNVYGQGGQLLFSSAKQGTSVWTTRFVYLGGKLIAETDANGVTTYEHTDALGSPVARSNAAGQLLSRTRYEPYGGFAAGNYNPGSTGLTDIGFTGHVNDPDTGLVYMQQRYYDPIAARFMSVDPVVTNANTGKSFSRYEYASNNPYRYLDPEGRQVYEPIKAIPSSLDQINLQISLRPMPTFSPGGIPPRGQRGAIPSPGDVQAESNSELAESLSKSLDHVGGVLDYMFRSDSVELARNMARSGLEREPGQHAHHIVAANDPRAAGARTILSAVKMDINSPINGVFLGANLHARIHTDVYHRAVDTALGGAKTYSDVAARLTAIAAAIQAGTFPR